MGKAKKYEWALTLAKDIKDWCAQHRRKPHELGKVLDIESRTWRDITSGRQIVEKSNGEVYAVIHYRLGLASADPRTIPPRLNRTPSGRTITIRRAWTEEEWQKWRKSRLESMDVTPQAVVLPRTGLEESLKQLVREAVREAQTGISDQNIGTLADELLRLLKEQGDTQEARDGIANKYGLSLQNLLPILDAFTQPRDRREEALKITEVFNA